jgi:hypothetical protein
MYQTLELAQPSTNSTAAQNIHAPLAGGSTSLRVGVRDGSTHAELCSGTRPAASTAVCQIEYAGAWPFSSESNPDPWTMSRRARSGRQLDFQCHRATSTSSSPLRSFDTHPDTGASRRRGGDLLVVALFGVHGHGRRVPDVRVVGRDRLVRAPTTPAMPRGRRGSAPDPPHSVASEDAAARSAACTQSTARGMTPGRPIRA